MSRNPARFTFTALIPLLVVLLFGCPKAVQRVDDHAMGRVNFAIEPGWEITHNRRFLGSHHVALSPDPPRAVLTVDFLRVGPGGEHLPLDLVAEGVVGQLGRKLGMETLATHEHEIELAGRRTIALTGIRRHGPREADFTAWVTRTPKRMLIVQLQTPRGELQGYSRLLSRLLESFELPTEPPPPDTLTGD